MLALLPVECAERSSSNVALRCRTSVVEFARVLLRLARSPFSLFLRFSTVLNCAQGCISETEKKVNLNYKSKECWREKKRKSRASNQSSFKLTSFEIFVQTLDRFSEGGENWLVGFRPVKGFIVVVIAKYKLGIVRFPRKISRLSKVFSEVFSLKLGWLKRLADSTAGTAFLRWSFLTFLVAFFLPPNFCPLMFPSVGGLRVIEQFIFRLNLKTIFLN